MRKRISLLLASIMVLSIFAVYAPSDRAALISLVSIASDKEFRRYLSYNFDSDKDGFFSQDELKEITKIDCSGWDIKVISGLNCFAYLEELNCSKCLIKELDISDNKGIEKLDCSNNLLTSLVLAEESELRVLHCENNYLTKLDIPEVNKLEEIWCYGNDIDVLMTKYLPTFANNKSQDTYTDRYGEEHKIDVYVDGLIRCDVTTKTVDNTVTVRVTDPGSSGIIVEGTGTYPSGTEVTLKALAKKGYEFYGWYQNNELLTTENEYTFTTGDKDVMFTAKFLPVTVATPTDEPVKTMDPSLLPSDSDTPHVKVNKFVNRLYSCVLGRAPEEEGAAYWTEQLYYFKTDGAAAARDFIYSEEFKNRNVSNEEFMKILYLTFFGREPDSDGMEYWMTIFERRLHTRKEIAEDFIYSQEWADTCAYYSILSGGNLWPVVKFDPTDEVNAFVTRMYTCALKRDPEPEGLKFWAKEVVNFKNTGEEIGELFFMSDEIYYSNLSDEEFLNRLYLTFMDREPDQPGKDYWLEQMKTKSRHTIILGFTRSPEFVEKCVEARIIPYK